MVVLPVMLLFGPCCADVTTLALAAHDEGVVGRCGKITVLIVPW